MIIGTLEIVGIVFFLTSADQHIRSIGKMCIDRAKLARVALAIGTEDDVFWVERHRAKCSVCQEAFVDLYQAGNTVPGVECLPVAELIEIADTGRMTRPQQDHLYECLRCAKIGQVIANMPSPKSDADPTPLSVSA